MTHEELLAICDNYSFKDSAEPVKALRAVVIRHKPYREPNWRKGYFECSECTGDIAVVYPCYTITDITKELK